MIADVEVKFAAARIACLLDRNAVVEPKRSDRQIQTKSDTGIRCHVVEAVTPRGRVDKSGVEEDCGAHLLDDRDGKFHGRPRQGITADGIAVAVLRTHVTEVKPAEIIGAAEEKPGEDRHTVTNRNVTSAPGIDAGNASVEEQDQIVGEVKVLRRLDIKSIRLNIAAQKTARDKRGDDEALSCVAEERIVTTVKEPGRPDLALKQRALLAPDCRGSARGHVEDVDLP